MKTIGKYQVLDEIGRSAAGATYRGRDPFRKRALALKLLSPVAALEEPARDQLYTELASCAELSHRHIAKIQDLGEVEGGVYVATELLTGADLGVHFASHDTVIAEKIALMAQVSEGLACAHSKGVAHGNIKPSNIFVVDGHDAVILDFGIGSWQSLLIAAGVRLNGLMPNYLAPEQILGQRFDARSDVFSVAVILYELLAGRYPFQAAAGVVPREIVHAEPPALRKLNPQVPEELEQLVVRALNKDPEARLQTADEFAASLFAVAQRLRKEGRETPADAAPQMAVETGVENQAQESETSAASQLTLDTLLAPASVAIESALPRTWPAYEQAASPSPAPIAAAPAAGDWTVPAPPLATPEQPPAPSPALVAVALPLADWTVPPAPPAPPAQPPARGPAPMAAAARRSTALEWIAPRPAPATPAPNPLKTSAPSLKATRRQLVTFAVGAVLAISLATFIVSRQNLGASQNQSHEPAPAADRADPQKSSRSETTKPTALQTAPAPGQQTAPEREVAQPATQQTLRVEVKSLWEEGRYTEAMRLVDGVLAASPANSEARAWKKKIRAAQDAEGTMR